MNTPGNGMRNATASATSASKTQDRKYRQRQPIWLKRDKFARHGEALLLAALADDPLERCLAVVRFVLAVLGDMLRPGGPDPDDLPITSLGHHHVTVRQLSTPGLRPGRPAAMSAPAGAPNGGGYGPSLPCVHVQEILSFDPNEGPKELQLAQGGRRGPFKAVAALKIEPWVKIKAKRLGRDVSIKVRLEGGGNIVLLSPEAAANLEPSQRGIPGQVGRGGREGGPAAASPLGAAAAAAPPPLSPMQPPNTVAAAAAAAQERYTVVLPNLVLRGSLPYAARPDLHGDLIIQCPGAGLMASLTFKEDGVVRGVLEKLQPQVQRRQRATSGGSILSASGAAAAGVGTASAVTAGKMSSVYGVIGNFMGSLYDSIHVTCSELGLEGTLHSEQPPLPGLPPLSQLMDLSHPGPQQLPRLWTAVHDSLLYNDPKQVSGGKAAEEVSRRLASDLHSLFADGSSLAGGGTRDGGTARTAMAASAASGAGGGPVAAPSSGAAAVDIDSDSDSDFEAAARDDGDMVEDPRDVPPSYKAVHAASRRACWQLHYTVVTAAASGTGAECAEGGV